MSAPSTTRGWCGRCGGYRHFLEAPFRCLTCGTHPSHRHAPGAADDQEGSASVQPTDVALPTHGEQAAT